jgi:hypothetical protein
MWRRLRGGSGSAGFAFDRRARRRIPSGLHVPDRFSPDVARCAGAAMSRSNQTHSEARTTAAADERRRQHGVVRSLIWAYFILLLLEGPLRKWIVPDFEKYILLSRDPVLLLIYVAAIGSHVLRLNWILALLGIVAALTTASAMTAGHGNIGIALYGLDANFLHLPLVFIMAEAMDRRDVLKIGTWLLWLSVPMALLMTMQFRAHPNDWVNFGPGASPGSQMQSVLGKIRPPGIFTFVTGAAMYITLTTAVVLFGFLQRTIYHRVFLCVCALSLVICTMVSTSRLVLGGVSVVFIMIGVIGLYDRTVVRGALSMLVPLGIVFMIATTLDVFHEGKHVFEARFDNTGDSQANLVQTASTWSERIWGGFLAGFEAAGGAKVLGEGIGYGTNVAARMLTGAQRFMADEREWGRVVIEMGPVLAAPYLLARIAMVWLLFRAAVRSARIGNYLPMLLLGSCGLSMLNGQFGVASILGFTVFQAGMCLASARTGEGIASSVPNAPAAAGPVRKKRGRSAHAAALHSGGEQPRS